MPRASELFEVAWVNTAADGVAAVGKQAFVALVAKLGSEGNGIDVMNAFRAAHGEESLIAIHSATATGSADM